MTRWLLRCKSKRGQDRSLESGAIRYIQRLRTGSCHSRARALPQRPTDEMAKHKQRSEKHPYFDVTCSFYRSVIEMAKHFGVANQKLRASYGAVGREDADESMNL